MKTINPAEALLSNYQLSKASTGSSGENKNPDSPEALRAVAKQFESVFMNLILKNMRAVNREFSEGNYLNTFETRMYEDMLDEKLSVSMSESGGLGIADMLVKQLGKQVTTGRTTTPLEYQRPVDKEAVAISQTQISERVAGRQAVFSDAEDFVTGIFDEVIEVSQQMDVSPYAIIAQAALETGWGQHIIHDAAGKNTFNLFGIKANNDWQGASVNIDSVEVKDNVVSQVRSRFKSYSSYAESLGDYVNLLGSNRYQTVQGAGNDINAFATRLEKSGYATDPNYAKKIVNASLHPAISGHSASGHSGRLEATQLEVY